MRLPEATNPKFYALTDLGAIRQSTPAEYSRARNWLANLPPPELFYPLCLLLPAVADFDPAFARWMLDPRNWKRSVCPDFNPSRPASKYFFEHVTGNAMLHVLAALANNHFGELLWYADHPQINGSYSGLLPQYLMTVMYRKVVVLGLL